jgi:hypothetical protein
VAITGSSGVDAVGTISAMVARTATSEGSGSPMEATPDAVVCSPAAETESYCHSSTSNAANISTDGGTPDVVTPS